MVPVEQYIQTNLYAAWICITLSFIVLFKCADLFVDSSVEVARRFRIPRLIIGIILVSLATTLPELAVSVIAAFKGSPEISIGNAMGSVVCNTGLALALSGIITLYTIVVIPSIFHVSAIFLIGIEIILFFFIIFDNTLSRFEGIVLIILFAGYVVFLVKDFGRDNPEQETTYNKQRSIMRLCLSFLCALAGILIASRFIVTSANTIADSFHIPASIIAMTLVAFGTSVPEVATCIAAARKGEGSLAVGNILGANIMNICWVAGASAVVNNLTLGRKDILFMFPSMFIIVGIMLFMLRLNYSLNLKKGIILLSLYMLYLVNLFIFFPPQLN